MTEVTRDRVTTPATIEPLTVGDLKAHMRVFDTDNDGYIASLIVLVRDLCERLHNRAYLTQTRELTIDAFPDGRSIEIPRSPLQSVTSLKYTTSAGVETTLDLAANCHIDIRSAPARIVLKVDKQWPSDELISAGAIVIVYVAGWSFSASTVTISNASPAVVTWAAHGLSNGDPVAFSTTSALPAGLTADVTYYVTAKAAGTFQLAATPAGVPIGTTTAGSGTHTASATGNVPRTIVHAVKFLAAYYYENREAATDLAQVNELPKSFDFLLAQDRLSVFV